MLEAKPSMKRTENDAQIFEEGSPTSFKSFCFILIISVRTRLDSALCDELLVPYGSMIEFHG